MAHERQRLLADLGSVHDGSTAERPAIRVRVRQEVRIGRLAHRGPEPRLATDAEDAGAAPEVPARERDDLAPTGCRSREPDRRVVGVGAAHAEEDAIEPGRGDRDERLLEGDPRLTD